jgi:hypothetical protein
MKGITWLGALAAMWLMPTSLQAQTPGFDAAAYARAKEEATRTFLDRNLATQERLAALQRIGYPDAATHQAFLRLGADKTEDGTVRLEALRRHPYDDNYVNVVLKILGDPADGDADLDAGLILDLSRRTTSVPPAATRQRIQATLRKLMDDDREKVRLYAFRALVANHDQVAVSVLDESLRRGTELPVPPAEAIDLLNENGPTGHVNAIRPYLQHNDAMVQAKAVQALASDPESRGRIVELAMSDRTPVRTRIFALRALAREDNNFPKYATGLVEDPKTDPTIRDAAMTTVVGRMNYHEVEVEQQLRFARAVDRLAAETEPKTDLALKMRANAKELKAYLRKAFPEIQKFYDSH